MEPGSEVDPFGFRDSDALSADPDFRPGYAMPGLLRLCDTPNLKVWGKDQSVLNIGDRFLIPSELIVEAVIADQMVSATIWVEWGGRPRLRHLSLTSLPDGPGILQEDIRRIKINQLIDDVIAVSAFEVIRDNRGETVRIERLAGGTTEIRRRKVGDLLLALHNEQRAEPRRGVRVSDAVLREAARIYRDAFALNERAPTATVAAAMHLSRSTAGRYVAEARRRGFLGQATPRRAGERPQD